MSYQQPFGAIARSPAVLVDKLLDGAQRLLLWGEAGSGKSTLAAELARELARRGKACCCIAADPGSSPFGIPGSLCAGRWIQNRWHLSAVEALCSLNAARFRLPLVTALRRLTGQLDPGASLLIDAPGVTRGVAGAELLLSMAQASRVDAVLVVQREERGVPLPAELGSLGVRVLVTPSAQQACSPSKRERARLRTALWDEYLTTATQAVINAENLHLIGTPPPADAVAGWTGRQVAFLSPQGETLALGEVLSRERNHIHIRARPWRPTSLSELNEERWGPMLRREERGAGACADLTYIASSDVVLLVRDARRDATGLLRTAAPVISPTVRYQLPPDMAPLPDLAGALGEQPVAHLGVATATLVNGVFGDPLLHLRLRQQRRSLLFDLGEAVRLPARIAHQVTDVFISHAHMDHIGGFLWFLRSRIGDIQTCRVFGPPGLAANIRGLVSGIHWDRIGDWGPRFEVAELHETGIKRCRIQAGYTGMAELADVAVVDGILLKEPGFQVRAVTLDHGTPVLAFAFESARQINIDKEWLAARKLPAGPWLGELKRALHVADFDAQVRLPTGDRASVASLCTELVRITPGNKLAYATDLRDTLDNRAKLVALAAGAHTFFCEASFTEADVAHAQSTGHLTARACGEIATAAAVARLIPFHFSKRYGAMPEPLYREVRAACSRVTFPENLNYC